MLLQNHEYKFENFKWYHAHYENILRTFFMFACCNLGYEVQKFFFKSSNGGSASVSQSFPAGSVIYIIPKRSSECGDCFIIAVLTQMVQAKLKIRPLRVINRANWFLQKLRIWLPVVQLSVNRTKTNYCFCGIKRNACFKTLFWTSIIGNRNYADTISPTKSKQSQSHQPTLFTFFRQIFNFVHG